LPATREKSVGGGKAFIYATFLRSAVAVRCECAGVSRLHFNLLSFNSAKSVDLPFLSQKITMQQCK
jgi:hypothetical protein